MRDSVHANTVYTGDPVYSRHVVASRINAPAVVVAVVFTLDHIVTTQTTMGWTKSLQYPSWTSFSTSHRRTVSRSSAWKRDDYNRERKCADNNNNNNNKQICIAPQGRNVRGAGARQRVIEQRKKRKPGKMSLAYRLKNCNRVTTENIFRQ